MAVLSKHGGGFTLTNTDLPCRTLHPETSCARHTLGYFLSTFKGTGKFFLLLNLISLVMRRSVSPELLQEETISFLKTCLFGAICGGTPPGLICFFRWLLGRFYVITMGFIPGGVGGAGIFAQDPSKRGTNITFLLALVANLYLKIFEEKGLFKLSKQMELLIFSTCSSGLLYCLRAFPDSYTLMWPLVPHRVPSDPEARTHCRHKGRCLDSTRKTGFTYFCYGLAVQGIKVTAFNFKLLLSEPKSFFQAFVKLENFRLPLFAGLYISLFKGVSCLLLNLRGRDEAWQALLAGVVASLCYLIQPNLTLALLAFSNLSQILCREYKKKLKLPPWPWEEMLFMINMGLMFHARTAYPNSFPQHMTLIMDSATDGKAPVIYDLVEKKMIERH